MKLKAAIIDDEKHAIQTLSYDLMNEQGASVNIIFSTTNPIEGLKLLRKYVPDILFLDINMPGISGMDIVELIKDLPVKVIFTTAHEEYAIKAIETAACGYLLKPVQTEDLDRIISKIRDEKPEQIHASPFGNKISISDTEGIELIPYDKILYCKANDNYCEFHLIGNQKIIASKTLGYFADLLPTTFFFRTHKSFLINLTHIKKILKRANLEIVMSNDAIIPVSRNRKPEILKLMD